MSSDLLIGVIVWLVIMLFSPVVFFFCVPKPFSVVQKVGVLVSVLALVAILVLPVVSIAGILNFNFFNTMEWMIGQRGADKEELFEYFVPLFLAWFVSAPLISAMLYMGNVTKSVGGLLMIVPPVYLVVLGHISSFLERAGLASGSIAYLIGGILLIALPWIVKDNKEQQQGKKQLRTITPLLVAFIGLAPAICLQAFADTERQETIEVSDEEMIDTDYVEISDGEEVQNEEVDYKSGDIMPKVSAEKCFVYGLSNIAKYSPRKVETEDNSEVFIPQIYQYRSKKNYNIRAGVYKGSFALILSGDGIDFWNLDLGDFCNFDSEPEIFFGQSDIDGDGIDELIIAGRTTQEGGNRICLNVYEMGWEAGIPVKSIYNKITYNNMGIAFVEPTNGERNGYIEICEDETMEHKETWVLQDGFKWVSIDD